MKFLSSLDEPSTTPFGAPPVLSPVEASALMFQAAEPGEGQRWSTWPATIPTERGPEPRPDWLVTSAAAIDTELGVVKTGKEASLFLIERAVPDAPADVPGNAVLLAAKRYRSSEHSDFHRSAVYTEGRGTRRSRDVRAVAKGTSFGRSVARVQWAYAEFDALSRLTELGASVPYPVQVHDTEVLMEFIGDGRVAAPRLAQVRAGRDLLRDLFQQVADFMHVLARAGLAHGDLSPYNLLVHHGRVVAIDLPQVVDLVSNPQGFDLLHRDCVNVCEWFTRQRLECDAEELFSELVGEVGF
ncbi:serine protein kinase RIO [Agromyces bauzanensis]|uniref:non-specific serine/threonine protein kinase n=1 Tax=Agromyces bauzanensis TaxID=1308924 RepID=A0A917PT18_9MICO|nr:RIO1 family regulatory kinase/ATPase [Agromyces bauzanensis]GGJ90817.1 RIO kinase 1 [Agromyces bauzanensis]